MNAAAKEQTAFRFEPSLILSMKSRARSLGKSVNSYVTELIEKDLNGIHALPKVALPAELDDVVEKYAGCVSAPSQESLENDERLERIWNR